MKIQVWSAFGKQSVSIDDILEVTAKKQIFYAVCKNHQSGEINLDNFNLILELKPEIVDEKARELGEIREKMKLLFGNS